MNKKLNILIADDNKNFVEAFRFLLNNIEENVNIHEVYTAYNSEECMNVIYNHPVNIVFMDIDMPDANGDVTTKKIIDFNRYIKVIAVSFHNEIEYVKKMIKAGAINYITKENLSMTAIAHAIKSNS